MKLGEADEDSLTTAGSPLGYLDAALLKLRLQHEGGASPHMAIRKECTTALGAAAPKFDGCQTCLQGWDVVVQPNGMVHCHGPKIRRNVTGRAAKSSVEHHGTCHIHNCLNISFG